jgi:hypothetical protein
VAGAFGIQARIVRSPANGHGFPCVRDGREACPKRRSPAVSDGCHHTKPAPSDAREAFDATTSGEGMGSRCLNERRAAHLTWQGF